MTHFPVGIIVPPDKLSHLQNFIFEQMQPYDEAAEVDLEVNRLRRACLSCRK